MTAGRPRDIPAYHSAVWTWLGAAQPGTYRIDVVIPYISQLCGVKKEIITIQDRSLFIEAVMFWIDYDLHPNVDFNTSYTKMRIYPDPKTNKLTMKKLLYALSFCLLLSACGSLYTIPTDTNRYVLVTKKAVFVVNGDSTVKYIKEKNLAILKY